MAAVLAGDGAGAEESSAELLCFEKKRERTSKASHSMRTEISFDVGS